MELTLRLTLTTEVAEGVVALERAGLTVWLRL